jgi:hypothetical protein
MTIEDGVYQLACRAIETPGRDCGINTYEGPLEAGYVRGPGNVVYFVYDAEVHSALTGCETMPEVQPPCYSIPTYSASWSLDGDVLTFANTDSDFSAYHLTLVPWTKIA